MDLHNKTIAPKLTVIKTVVAVGGRTAIASDFTIAVTGQTDAPGVASPGTTVTMKVGAYFVSEVGVDANGVINGYQSSSSGDCSGTLTPGDVDNVCTITNTPIAPTISVVKKVNNLNGGSAVATDFSYLVNGGTATPFTATADTSVGAGSVASVVAGTTYTITEAAAVGYTPTFEGCVITPELGKNYTCTISNGDIAPTVVLRKVVVNDDGGTALAQSFNLSIDGTTQALVAGAAGTAASAPVTLKAGVAYDLAEAAVAGYAASGWSCEGGGTLTGASLTLGLGDDVTCTITNNDIAPKISVVKQVDNTNGGSAVATDFKYVVNAGGGELHCHGRSGSGCRRV